MFNLSNRLVTATVLIGAFAIVALAGRGVQTPPTTQNVVVTASPQDTNRFKHVFTISADGAVAAASASFPVPVGKRLIVDYISATTNSSETGNYFATIYLEDYNGASSSTLAYAYMKTESINGFTNDALGSEMMNFSLEPEETLYVFAARSTSNASGAASAKVTVCGHFVPVSSSGG